MRSTLLSALLLALSAGLLLPPPGAVATGPPSGHSTILAWGRDGRGQLGLGRILKNRCACSPRPKRITLPTNVVQVAAGDGFSLALGRNGRVWSWGANEFGQLGLGSTSKRGCRCRPAPARIPRFKGISRVSAQGSFALALDHTGHVWAWGANTSGQLALGPVCKPHISGCSHIPGSPRCVCINRPTVIPGLRDITEISAGAEHALALDRNGRVWGWGWNYAGQVGTGGVNTEACACVYRPYPDRIFHVRGIAAGNSFSLAVTDSGSVLGWGINSADELGNGGLTYGSCGCVPQPFVLRNLHNIRMVSAGDASSVALTKAGHLLGWGYDYWGNLGLGTRGVKVPFAIPASSAGRFRAVSAGKANTVAVTAGRTIVVWGVGSNGALGSGHLLKGGCACADRPLTVTPNGMSVAIGTGQVLALPGPG